MTGCVILNYNDAESVIALYKKISNYRILDRIIIVDGASTDDSYVKLKKLEDDHTIVLLADKNGGYGYGNNIGIGYCAENGISHVLIANPDVAFSESAVIELLHVFSENERCVAAAPRMRGRQPAYKLASPLRDIMFSSMVLNKVFKPRYYPNGYFENRDKCEVDVLPGSFVMFDVEKFIECGMYDENVFLYHEEIIMAKRFMKKGYCSILCLEEQYDHFHSVSVKKEFKSVIRPKKIAMDSHSYYLKNYCNANGFLLAVFGCMRPIAYAEALLWNWIKRNMSTGETHT